MFLCDCINSMSRNLSRYYVPKKWDNTTTISEFTASSSDPNMADVNSEKKILTEPHPQFNYNGGIIAFGAYGYLFLSVMVEIKMKG